MNESRAFFDTNVILYVYTEGDQAKQTRAKELFSRYAPTSRILLSTQVVQEVYAAGSRKLRLLRSELTEVIAALLKLPLVVNGPVQISAAIQIKERYNISFWDALILAAAESGGAEVVYTEDLNDGQQYGTVMAKNPFRESTI